MAYTEWRLEDTDPELAAAIKRAQDLWWEQYLLKSPVWRKSLEESFKLFGGKKP